MFAMIPNCPLLLSFIAKQFSTRTPCGLFKLTGHPTGSSQNAEPLLIMLIRTRKPVCYGCRLNSMVRFQSTQRKPFHKAGRNQKAERLRLRV